MMDEISSKTLGKAAEALLEQKAKEQAFLDLEKRCIAASIPFNKQLEGNELHYSLGLSCGRDKRFVSISGLGHVSRILSFPFENYVFLGNYDAICNYKDSYIESIIRPVKPLLSSSLIYKQLFGSDEETEKRSLDIKEQIDGKTVILSIGPMSKFISALSWRGTMELRLPSLKISGIQVAQHDVALKLLEKFANSIFFQLDLKLNVSLNLMPHRIKLQRGGRPLQAGRVAELQFPLSEYDQAPISLYWYARSADRMPLLQFLAYYQCIEFYFPAYSQAEAKRKIRNILKDPTFWFERDADLARILTAVKGGGYSGFGDENEQLRATIRECLDPNALREFLSNDKEREKFLSSKTEGLANHKLPIINPKADLRNDVADRIYEIRCKIVHTKSGNKDGDVDLLLPFSPEAELLYHDIDLIQYIARQVLIAASTPFRI